MPRPRHQTGSVQQRIRGGRKAWVGLYWHEGKRKITPLDARTRPEAESLMVQFLAPLNAAGATESRDPAMTLGDYCEHVYIPLGRRKWKAITAGPTESRLVTHIVRSELGKTPLRQLHREQLQKLLDARKDQSASVVTHLRFDLQAICRLALADGLISRNPAIALYTPRQCVKVSNSAVMNPEQVAKALAALDIRERLFCRLAIFAGMRPGEIIALRWEDIDGLGALVSQRIYKGLADLPKNGKIRSVSLSPLIESELQLWRAFASVSEYVFPSENLAKPIWYQNLWNRYIQPRLAKIGLEWANFQVMRRTNASLMKFAGADVKVSADQRGHNVGVSINEYTQSTAAQKAEAVRKLEELIH